MKSFVAITALIVMSGVGVGTADAYGGGGMVFGSSPTAPGYQVNNSNIPSEPSVPASNPQGEVLGASVACGVYLNDYLHIDWNNDSGEVSKLQSFLNEYMGAGLPVTGFFGPMTLEAVKAFQAKESEMILAPWVNAGLHEGTLDPTGFVFKTTKHVINKIKCPELNLPAPQLP